MNQNINSSMWNKQNVTQVSENIKTTGSSKNPVESESSLTEYVHPKSKNESFDTNVNGVVFREFKEYADLEKPNIDSNYANKNSYGISTSQSSNTSVSNPNNTNDIASSTENSDNSTSIMKLFQQNQHQNNDTNNQSTSVNINQLATKSISTNLVSLDGNSNNNLLTTPTTTTFVSGNIGVCNGLTSLHPQPQNLLLPSEDEFLWYYLDPRNVCQGPFPDGQMFQWWSQGIYFQNSLFMRRKCDVEFSTLQDYSRRFGGVPFCRKDIRIPPLIESLTHPSSINSNRPINPPSNQLSSSLLKILSQNTNPQMQQTPPHNQEDINKLFQRMSTANTISNEQSTSPSGLIGLTSMHLPNGIINNNLLDQQYSPYNISTLMMSSSQPTNYPANNPSILPLSTTTSIQQITSTVTINDIPQSISPNKQPQTQQVGPSTNEDNMIKNTSTKSINSTYIDNQNRYSTVNWANNTILTTSASELEISPSNINTSSSGIIGNSGNVSLNQHQHPNSSSVLTDNVWTTNKDTFSSNSSWSHGPEHSPNLMLGSLMQPSNVNQTHNPLQSPPRPTQIDVQHSNITTSPNTNNVWKNIDDPAIIQMGPADTIGLTSASSGGYRDYQHNQHKHNDTTPNSSVNSKHGGWADLVRKGATNTSDQNTPSSQQHNKHLSDIIGLNSENTQNVYLQNNKYIGSGNVSNQKRQHLEGFSNHVGMSGNFMNAPNTTSNTSYMSEQKQQSSEFITPLNSDDQTRQKIEHCDIEFENLINWCKKYLQNKPAFNKVDITTLVELLKDVESPYEVEATLNENVPEFEGSAEFVRLFFEKRRPLRQKLLQNQKQAFMNGSVSTNHTNTTIPTSNATSSPSTLTGNGASQYNNVYQKKKSRSTSPNDDTNLELLSTAPSGPNTTNMYSTNSHHLNVSSTNNTTTPTTTTDQFDSNGNWRVKCHKSSANSANKNKKKANTSTNNNNNNHNHNNNINNINNNSIILHNNNSSYYNTTKYSNNNARKPHSYQQTNYYNTNSTTNNSHHYQKYHYNANYTNNNNHMANTSHYK